MTSPPKKKLLLLVEVNREVERKSLFRKGKVKDWQILRCFKRKFICRHSVSLLQVDQVAERRQSLAAVESLNVRRGTLKRGSIAKVTLVFY